MGNINSISCSYLCFILSPSELAVGSHNLCKDLLDFSTIPFHHNIVCNLLLTCADLYFYLFALAWNSIFFHSFAEPYKMICGIFGSFWWVIMLSHFTLFSLFPAKIFGIHIQIKKQWQGYAMHFTYWPFCDVYCNS